ncbi:hypothetical protein BV25DRAFT_1829242 [Artomyces pyxidatus]|uniref:Uncharacterized protein n=1 Tax=Artomyces pyxidatus TaxID=48021 RepID=A0ACB8STT0_9AGAM|nr:hypothetical protein BV25DRAFT_1829242 [Artomyces pyxidatus]
MKAVNSFLIVVPALAAVVRAQQLITTTNALGFSIVEQITTDALGDLITQTILTLPPGASSAPSSASSLSTTSPLPASTSSPLTSSAATSTSAPSQATTPITTTPDQVGPVNTPAPLPVQGETPFTYTTTDANGNYIPVLATFSPTFPAPIQPIPVTTGTILGYSQWLGQIGNATADLNSPVPSVISNAGMRIQTGILGIISSVAVAVVGGTILVLG